jgi:hypothetical protein
MEFSLDCAQINFVKRLNKMMTSKRNIIPRREKDLKTIKAHGSQDVHR